MMKDFLQGHMNGATINAATGLKNAPASKSAYVDFGYGQVEPNHLSAQRTGQIYAQLPAKEDIEILEQGQFVKYDYAANDNGVGLVDFEGAGEWMLVYNEIKLYRDHPDGTKQWDCEFAMIKDDYASHYYSPYDYEHADPEYVQGRYYNGKDEQGHDTWVAPNQWVYLDNDQAHVTIDNERYDVDPATKTFSYNGTSYTLSNVGGRYGVQLDVVYAYDDVTKDVSDPYDPNFTNDPYKILNIYRPKKMPAGSTMVPRVFKTNVGDIYTTNTLADEAYAVGDILSPIKDTTNPKVGFLAKSNPNNTSLTDTSMQWQVVKLYTMPDGQKGVKLMRIV